jgi:hypothetical protein
VAVLHTYVGYTGAVRCARRRLSSQPDSDRIGPNECDPDLTQRAVLCWDLGDGAAAAGSELWRKRKL